MSLRPSCEPVRLRDLREAIAHRRDGGERRAVAPREDRERPDEIAAAMTLVLHHEAVALGAEEGILALVRRARDGVLRAIHHRERRTERAHPTLDELVVARLVAELEIERREEALAGVV